MLVDIKKRELASLRSAKAHNHNVYATNLESLSKMRKKPRVGEYAARFIGKHKHDQVMVEEEIVPEATIIVENCIDVS